MLYIYGHQFPLLSFLECPVLCFPKPAPPGPSLTPHLPVTFSSGLSPSPLAHRRSLSLREFSSSHPPKPPSFRLLTCFCDLSFPGNSQVGSRTQSKTIATANTRPSPSLLALLFREWPLAIHFSGELDQVTSKMCRVDSRFGQHPVLAARDWHLFSRENSQALRSLNPGKALIISEIVLCCLPCCSVGSRRVRPGHIPFGL